MKKNGGEIYMAINHHLSFILMINNYIGGTKPPQPNLCRIGVITMIGRKPIPFLLNLSIIVAMVVTCTLSLSLNHLSVIIVDILKKLNL